jgi:hypothetical protein
MRSGATRALLIPAILLLGACATATPYQPAAKDGQGYTEQRLETNRFRVNYAGNTATPRATVENYVMYRAAEITLNQGYDWFAIADQRTNIDPRSSSGVSTGVGLGIGGGSGNFGTGISIGLGTLLGGGNKESYNAQADILLFRNPKPADTRQGYDAREVKANLEAVIQRPKPGKS